MRFSRLALTVGLLCLASSGQARTWQFDPASLGEAGRGADMTLFNQGLQQPGTYRVDILLNGERVDTLDIVFSLAKDRQGQTYLEPCLSVAALSAYGVRVEDYPGLSAGSNCARLQAIPQATTDFQFSNQQLLLNIPQVSLRPKLRGIAPPQLWNDGITALLLNYRAGINHAEARTEFGGDNATSGYVQLNPGANLGAWRLRNQTNWQQQGEGAGRWQAAYTYLERGFYTLKSRLTLGEHSAGGEIFDSVPFRGGMLATDEQMVPYNQREFAPIVRGIARTQARIEVRQDGYVVYETTVAPGPFALTDLTTQGGGRGNLQVTVREADGTVREFSVPYQTPAIALREGYMKYRVMAGQYRPSDSSVDKTMVGLATLMYGLPMDMTVYGGLQSARHYLAEALGVGVSMGAWGALSLDATLSHGQRRGEEAQNGTAWRLRYSKEVESTNTTLALTSYRYASRGFSTLSDVLDTWRSEAASHWNSGRNGQRKSTTTLSLNQSLGGWGGLSLSGTRSDYWDRPGHDTTYGVSYGTNFGGVSVSLGWDQTRQVRPTGEEREDRVASLWLSIPLDRWLGNAVNANYQMTSPSVGRASQELGLSGRAFDQRLSWDVRQSYRGGDNSGDRNSSALNMNWFGGYGRLGGHYSYSPALRQMGADMDGGMVVHRHGVTLGQSLSDTVALVEAPGASGVTVIGSPGITTDRRGYATQPYLAPYQENTVSLDPTHLPADAEVPQTDIRVVPTKGAVVAARFATRIGGRALMTLTLPDGVDVPFGALVTLKGDGASVGVVGESGKVYLTGLPDKGELHANWAARQCLMNYRLPDEGSVTGMYSMSGVCRPVVPQGQG
ncbi:fimbrial biogenesis outer membrane usher protein [Serratia marcescens]|uniref:Fimbrial biogenesis outer membrane usher protein n=1 Tax=Serratia marcescens TaxID=615 RepID=A0A5C7BJX9_SERMA|nr:fimbrial biogenesis outer membrane usher protein [Serratia marcescens]TXE24303.1 fimbrial biogenesis outer membrane usher protein [Serratia marcescens]TXE53290.1 fimbrial biogenesis outer membrane usher protein [Serratia marcescens]